MRDRVCLALAVALIAVAASAAMGQSGGLTPMEELGKMLFFDKISEPRSMACADCHGADAGFAGPVPGINLHGAAYRGAVPQRFGNRKPPTASYATFSPVLHFDEIEGLFLGGNFWDGRATGEILGNPAADQALGPFLNPVEQNNASKKAVIEIVAASKYTGLWEEVWDEPISYETPSDVERDYARIGLAIEAYESSPEVNQFSSKFDMFWHNAGGAGMDVAAITAANWEDYTGLGLSDDETEGLALFNDEDKGKCSLCHVLDAVTDKHGMERPPVFTDFSFDNLGVPRNPQNPFYDMDRVYLDDGSPINPLGDAWVDLGLGGFLESRPDYQAMVAENYGKQKVPTLRNVDKRPGETFPKAYTHNGFFKSLEEVVHFYNTRDVEDWPPPEVADNVNTDELGDLGLSASEERLIVSFLRTLSDGFQAKGRPMRPLAGEAGSTHIVTCNCLGPSPSITLAIHEPGTVSVDLFNVAGQKVATLVEDRRDGDIRTVGIDAAGLSSGVYFARVSGRNDIAAAKIIVLK